MRVLGVRLARSLAFLLTLGIALGGCSTPSGDKQNASPKAAEGPATPKSVAVQPEDLPSRFHECSFSGEVNAYIENFKRVEAPAYRSLVATWTELQSLGAKDGYFAVYGDGALACNDVIGKEVDQHDDSLHDDPKGHPSAVWSFVARFKDDAAATAVFKDDVFGQSKLQSIGLEVVNGDPTGLGPNSAVGTNQADAPVRRAIWQNKAFTVFFGSENLKPEESLDVTAAVDGRIS